VGSGCVGSQPYPSRITNSSNYLLLAPNLTEPWELVPPDKPYGTLDAMLRAEIRHTEEGVRVSLGQKMVADPEVQPLAEHGGARAQVDVVNLCNGAGAGGNSSEYLIRQLKRDAPEIAKRLAKGEFPSARAAAIEAGIVKVPTPLDTLRKAWAKERKAFVKWMEPEGD
jgi:hypothetical protein